MTTMRSLAALPAAADVAELLWLGDERAGDPALTGGEAAKLSRSAAVPDVPPGVVLTVPGATLPRELRRALSAAHRRLRELVGTAAPPRRGRPAPGPPPRAVPAPPLGGAAPQPSFPGDHAPSPTVRGAGAVWGAAAPCFAPFGAQRALDSRRDRGLAEAPERVAVLVQWL